MSIRKKRNLGRGFITTILLLTFMLAMTITVFATADTGDTVTVNTSDVNVRDAAGTNGNKIAVVQTNTVMTVLGSENDSEGKLWYHVSWTDGGEEKTGYIRYDFVTVSAPQEPQEPTQEVSADNADTGTTAESNGNSVTLNMTGSNELYPKEGDGAPDNLPEGFREIAFNIAGQPQVPAWTNDEYYIFYAVSPTGTEGWYLFDSVEGSYVRYQDFISAGSISAGATDSVSDNGSSSGGVPVAVVIIMAVVIVLLIAATVFLGLKQIGNASDDDDEDDDDDDDDERPRRRSLFARHDDDDDDEDDDDDDDDDDEPIRQQRQVQRNGQVRTANGQVVRTANGQVVRTANGQVVRRANGQVVRTANGQIVRRANGQVVRTQRPMQQEDEDDE